MLFSVTLGPLCLYLYRSSLYLDGPLFINNDGLHGMEEKCREAELSSGAHIALIEGFQAGGGVGMVATYSGPDTRGRKVLMQSGKALSSRQLPTLSEMKESSAAAVGQSSSKSTLMRKIYNLTRKLRKQVNLLNHKLS